MAILSRDGLPFTPLIFRPTNEPKPAPDWQVVRLSPVATEADDWFDAIAFEDYCNARMQGKFD